MSKIPREIIAIPNTDKAFHERWTRGRDPLNFPHPFRVIMAGPPNCGKGVCCKNILMRAKPDFMQVVVVHPDAEYTTEWDDITNVVLTGEIPSPDDFAGEIKTMVIIDDVDALGLSKEMKSNLDRLFGYSSTHKNVSVMMNVQDGYRVSPGVRRCANVFVIFRNPDMRGVRILACGCGIVREVVDAMFQGTKAIISEPRDGLWIDLTEKSPWPLRKNGYEDVGME
jgi:hypothetical protein